MNKQTSMIRNVKLNYAKVYQAEENPFGKEQFDIQVEFTKDRIDELSPFGKVRSLDNGNFAINITRPAVNNKGQKNTIRVVNNEKAIITDPIGNGSTGNLIVYSYDWSTGGRSGRKTILIAVQITELVPYNPESNVDFDLIVNDGKETIASQDF
jgi:hypothetical protein